MEYVSICPKSIFEDRTINNVRITSFLIMLDEYNLKAPVAIKVKIILIILKVNMVKV